MWNLNNSPEHLSNREYEEEDEKGKRVGSVSNENSGSSSAVFMEDGSEDEEEEDIGGKKKRSHKIFGFSVTHDDDDEENCSSESEPVVTRQFFPVDESEMGMMTMSSYSGTGVSHSNSNSNSNSNAPFPRAQWVGVKFCQSAPVGSSQPIKKSRRGPRSRSSQYRGVTFYRRTGRWESHIWDCGKQVYLGGFDTAHAAARAYDRGNEESIFLMVETESHHLPRHDYLRRLQSGELDSSMRRDAVEWIFKVHAHYSFGPLSAYLSVNYLDRFLSVYELPKGKSWMMQLLAVSCLSLAAKMDETDVPLSLDLQVCEAKFVFEAKTIQRMELLVLSTLKWRLRAVTPFSFIDYFLCKFNNDQPLPRYLISRSVEIILSILEGVDCLKFRPSEVAVAVAISVLGETQTVDMDNAAPHFIQHVEKESVLKCIEMIQDISSYTGSVKVSNSAPLSSVPQSPIGVLDAAACLSYKSDEQTVGSCANSSLSSPEAKRRKLNQPSELDSKS